MAIEQVVAIIGGACVATFALMAIAARVWKWRSRARAGKSQEEMTQMPSA